MTTMMTFVQRFRHWLRDLGRASSRPPRGPRRLGFDPLEQRAMLAAVPELVADIGNRNQATGEVIQIGSTIFYQGTDTSTGLGTELWKTDLNTFQATLVRDIAPGAGSAYRVL